VRKLFTKPTKLLMILTIYSSIVMISCVAKPPRVVYSLPPCVEAKLFAPLEAINKDDTNEDKIRKLTTNLILLSGFVNDLNAERRCLRRQK